MNDETYWFQCFCFRENDQILCRHIASLVEEALSNALINYYFVLYQIMMSAFVPPYEKKGKFTMMLAKSYGIHNKNSTK